jgi:YHS domain-containing protein
MQAQAPREVQGVMVKDEICGVYIPRDAALREVRDGVEHFFCSEECRRKLKAR